MNHTTIRRLSAVLIACFTLALFAGCMGETPEPADLHNLLKEGKKNLEADKGSIAYNYFIKALKIDPDNVEAHYGVVLSLDHRIFANIDGIIDLLAGVYIYEPSTDECRHACARLNECDLYEEAWTTPEDCLQDCPFNLQEYMFDTMIDGSTCNKIRNVGLEWIVPTTPENCKSLCEDLDLCGNIQPPVTFTVEECIEHCPWAYVERHSKCYLQNLGECNGYDRTCFEHTTVGLQILFREIGINVPPQIMEYADVLLARENDYQYFLDIYNWSLVDPPVDIDWEGRFDHGFLYLSEALGHGFYALLLFATSVQLEMNFPNFDLNFNYGSPDGAEEIVDAAIRSMEILLYDPIYPNGFTVFDEPWAFEQLKEGGQNLGMMFGSIARMFDFMLNDRDRQNGKALSYGDENRNFEWDEDEVVTIPSDQIDISINRAQAIAIRDLGYAIENNLLTQEPFDVRLLTDVLESFNLGAFDFVIDLLVAWTGDGMVDLSSAFWEPTRYSFRQFLASLIDELKIVANLIDELGL